MISLPLLPSNAWCALDRISSNADHAAASEVGQAKVYKTGGSRAHTRTWEHTGIHRHNKHTDAHTHTHSHKSHSHRHTHTFNTHRRKQTHTDIHKHTQAHKGVLSTHAHKQAHS